MTAVSTAATAQPERSGATSWIALAVLFAIGACSMADRYLLAMLAPFVFRTAKAAGEAREGAR